MSRKSRYSIAAWERVFMPCAWSRRRRPRRPCEGWREKIAGYFASWNDPTSPMRERGKTSALACASGWSVLQPANAFLADDRCQRRDPRRVIVQTAALVQIGAAGVDEHFL